jgi:hypothetical protein
LPSPAGRYGELGEAATTSPGGSASIDFVAELTVDVNVEDPARARHDLDCADHVLPLLEDGRRQTGGVRPRPSGDAVLDADVVAFGHRLDSTTWHAPGRAA